MADHTLCAKEMDRLADQAVVLQRELEEELEAALDIIENLMEENVKTVDAVLAHAFLVRHARRRTR